VVDTTMQEDLIDYIRDLYASEDEILLFIREDSAAEGLPQIHISSEEGRMIQVLLTAIGARRVVEIGTLAGYSGVWIARALPAGRWTPDHAGKRP
jgi:predicted O-methyltransferase YrrM